ncbi:hypothetical protein G9A89_020117 [Geosiphon pyriformis]|nr:hypothetical protein G9A89_020117 [Geosiphon pyriformis]
MEPSSNTSVKFTESKKKRRGFKIGDTTESDSVDIEKEFLVEKTSFDYGDGSTLIRRDLEQTPKNSKILTKKTLKKPLRKINFLGDDATEKTTDIKILVNTDLKKSTGCSDRTVVLKKIPVGTSAETVHAVLSEYDVVQKAVVKFGKIEQTDLVIAYWSILIGKDVMDHYRALLYTLPIEINAHNIWDFIGLVSEKTCVIDYYPITYAQTRCVVVCFKLAKFLDAVIDTTLVLKDVNLCWSCLSFSKCAKCEKIGHTLLDSLSDIDKSRLAIIYAKHLAFIAYPIAGGSLFSSLFMHNNLVNSGSSLKIKPILFVTIDIEKKFAVLESSLISLMGQISKLAKKLDLFMPTVSQSNLRCQLPVTPSLQNQVGNVVMGESSSATTGGETTANLDFFASPKMKRLENMLEGLSALVLSLIAKFNGSILAGSAFSKLSSQ